MAKVSSYIGLHPRSTIELLDQLSVHQKLMYKTITFIVSDAEKMEIKGMRIGLRGIYNKERPLLDSLTQKFIFSLKI